MATPLRLSTSGSKGSVDPSAEGQRGSLKNVRDNPWGQCHKTCASAASSNVNITLAFPALIAIPARHIASILSTICSFPSPSNVKLGLYEPVPSADSNRATSSCCSIGTQTMSVDPPGIPIQVDTRECESATQQVNQPLSSSESSASRSPPVASVVADELVDEPMLANQSQLPKGVFASMSQVDQAVDATESSLYRPAQLPSFIPSNAKSFFYWQLSLNRVNVLRDNLLRLVESFNGEVAAYFDSLRGPRLKIHDFMKHPFPFPAKSGLKNLHAYLGDLLFQEGYTEEELLDDTEVDAAFDNEFDFRLRQGQGFVNVNYAPGVVCSHCGEDGASAKCTRCKLATYCGRDCQSAHWKTHKLCCVETAAKIVANTGSGIAGSV